MRSRTMLLLIGSLWASRAHATGLAEAVAALGSAEAAAGIDLDDYYGDVPAPLDERMADLRHAIRDAIGDELRIARQLPEPPGLSALAARVTPFCDPDSPLGFGCPVEVRLERPRGFPHLVLAVVALSLPCGTDDAAYLFDTSTPDVTLVIADESEHYETVAGAHFLLQAAVAGAGDGGFYLAIVERNPWCSSNWQTLHHRILRPGEGPDRPRVLHAGEEGIYTPDEWELDAADGELHLSFWVSQQLDPAWHTRKKILALAIHGDAVTRIAPIADDPVEFLGEWLALPWAEAREYADPRHVAELHRWHVRLADPKGDLSTELEAPVREAGATWQVPLLVEGSTLGYQRLTFRVEERGPEGDLVMVSVVAEPVAPPAPGR